MLSERRSTHPALGFHFGKFQDRSPASSVLCASTYRVAGSRCCCSCRGTQSSFIFPPLALPVRATQQPRCFSYCYSTEVFFPPEIYHSGFSVTGMWNIYLEGRMTLKLKTECSLQTPRGQLPPPPSPLSITWWAAPCRIGKPGEALKKHTYTGPFLVF